MIPLTRDLVLLGGGHAHALVLRQFAMNPLPGLRITVIDPCAAAAYSGMLPGFVAGHYPREALDIDLVRLTQIAGARLVLGAATGIDVAAGTVQVAGRPPVAYDMLSVDVGITTAMTLSGFAEHAIPAKPLGPFAAAWAQHQGPAAVIGGGVAGAELAMAMAHKTGAPVHLIDRSAALSELAPRAARIVRDRMARLGVVLHEHAPVDRLGAGKVMLTTGQTIDAGFIVGAAGAQPYPWLADTGLAVTDGFLTVGPTLQTSDPNVFAAGDCAHLSHAPRPKAGVFAVRQAPVLFANLRAVARGRPPTRRYWPQKRYLKLVSLGAREALADRGGAVAGRLMWRWKDRIDRAFMRKFTDLTPMSPPVPTETAQGALGSQMLCAGCGGKVVAPALAGVRIGTRPDILPLPHDDAAALRIGGQVQVLSTDHLRAVVDDPVLMTRIAAQHALGDIWAMGAAPQAALTQVTLPRMSAQLQARTMAEIGAVAADAMEAAGAAIVGGHSTMGAELVIGFAVTGLCDQPIGLAGARAGDQLVLTKPIGSGTLMAAQMRGLAKGDEAAACYDWMVRSNATSAETLRGARAMTDVTGFGLAGHLWAICRASNVSARLTLPAIPLMAGAERLARAGVYSSIWPDNRASVPLIDRPDNARSDLLFDPQTAGGLLAAVPKGWTGEGWVIGEITDGPPRIVCD